MYSSATNEDGTQTENILGNSLIYTYNSEYNQVTGKTVSTKAFSHSSVVTEDEIEYSISSDVDISVTTDWFGRTESKEISVDSVKTNTSTEETSELNVTGEYNYIYADTENTASTKVTAHSSTFTSDSNTYSQTDYYEYDASGNITGIYRYIDDVKTYYYTYVYDEAGQLIRENILEDNKSIIYYYDMGGNIFAKIEYEYTLGEITAISNTLSTKKTSLTSDEKIFIATVAGEAIGENEITWKAVANVIKNRVGYKEWRNYSNTTDIIKNTGFDGYQSNQYNLCMNYLNNRTGKDTLYENLINTVLPIINNKETDCTKNSVLFYNPSVCSPNWDFSLLEEVIISGVNRNRFRFFRYI